MKESEFNRRLKDICGNDILKQHEYLKKFKTTVFDAYSDGVEKHWKLFSYNHSNEYIESGIYLTLRCGYSGIYQTYNIWDSKSKKWQFEIADGSYTIMYKDIKPYII